MDTMIVLYLQPERGPETPVGVFESEQAIFRYFMSEATGAEFRGFIIEEPGVRYKVPVVRDRGERVSIGRGRGAKPVDEYLTYTARIIPAYFDQATSVARFIASFVPQLKKRFETARLDPTAAHRAPPREHVRDYRAEANDR
jgi:hypothetical protein